ncbi:hypothetical protein GCM10027048_11040 [Hymenobacter coalescens]
MYPYPGIRGVVEQIGENLRLGSQIAQMLLIRHECAIRIVGDDGFIRPLMLMKEAGENER